MKVAANRPLSHSKHFGSFQENFVKNIFQRQKCSYKTSVVSSVFWGKPVHIVTLYLSGTESSPPWEYLEWLKGIVK